MTIENRGRRPWPVSPPQLLSAAPHVPSFGLIEGRPVFMDPSSDSYFMLDGQLEPAFHAARAMKGIALDAPLRQALGAEPSNVAEASCDKAADSILDAGPARTSFADVVRVARIVVRTRALLSSLPIGSILSDDGGREATGNRVPVFDSCVTAACRFHAARRFVPVKRNCLLDSLSLIAWLGPASDGAILIFGVKLHPFAAHCWVQDKGLILSDRLQAVSRFTPVRTIRCSSGLH